MATTFTSSTRTWTVPAPRTVSNPDLTESIYNLIKDPVVVPEKAPLYKKTLEPLGSKRAHGTMGKAKTAKPDQTNFLKRDHKRLDKPAAFARPTEDRKPRPPDQHNADGRPIHGLRSQRNFLKYNAISVMLAEPPQKNNEPVRYVAKKEYGQVPGYLENVKKQIDEEQQYISAIAEKEQNNKQPVQMLPEAERLELLGGLRANLEQMKHKHARLPFIADTIGRKQRKEGLEAKMSALEKDITVLSKPRVFISNQ